MMHILPNSPRNIFSSPIILLSFCVAMKERLNFSPGHTGAIWRFARSVATRRRSHRHDELELNLVISGTARYLVDERRYDLSPGTLIWLFADQDHLLLDESDDYAMWIIVVTPALLRRICTQPPARPLLATNPEQVLVRKLPPRVASRLGTVFDEVAAAGADIDRSNAGFAFCVLWAWAAFNNAGASALGSDVHPAVDKAARFLRDESDLENLDKLAHRCGLSRSRLSRLFKQQAGVSLVQYRQRQCLERFFTFYGSGQRLTLLEAALQAGFGSYPHFHRVFKQMTKCSPADYRRQQRNSTGALAEHSSS
jgi:AraC-like DNA-binding protein